MILNTFRKSKLSLFFVLLLILALHAGATEVKTDENLFILASDVHVIEGLVKRAKGFTADTTANCRNLVQDVLAMNPRPFALFLLGDNVETSSAKNVKKFRELLQPITNAGIELVVIMGNHDIPQLFDAQWPELQKGFTTHGFYARRYNTPSVDFLFLDTTDRSGKDGYYSYLSPKNLDWLRTELNASNKPVFICAHHPLNFEKYNLAASSHPSLQGWIHGHLHEWYEKPETAVRTLALPSVGFMDGGKRPVTGYVVMRVFPDRYTFTLVTNDRADDRCGTTFTWPVIPRNSKPE